MIRPPAIVNFDFWDTPHPVEQGFMIEAGQKIDSTPLVDYTKEIVLFSNLPAWVTHNAQVPTSLQGYRLVHAEKSGLMTRRFYFARVTTPEERKTPIKKERWTKRMWPWPTVLLKLWAEKGIIPNTSVDASGNLVSTDSLHERVRYRKGDSYPTWFRITEYMSEAGFGKEGSLQIVPITDSIHWSFDGFSGSFPDCMHPGVQVPNRQMSGQVLFGFGTPTKEVGGDIVSQDYPPTPMEDWEDYVIEDDRKVVMGLMEHRTLVEAYPPIDDREVQA